MSGSRFHRGLVWFARADVQLWFNGGLMSVWAVMIPIVLLLADSLGKSILFLTFLSVWALFATHLGAWVAALVNVKAARIEEHASVMPEHAEELHAKVDHLITHLEVPPLPPSQEKPA